MRAEFVNPFVQAATDILEDELGAEVDRGSARLQKSAYTTTEVTALIEVAGQVEGLVLFTMNLATALSITSTLLGREVLELDVAAQDSLRVLEEQITKKASELLSEAGYVSTMAPPALIQGTGVMLTTLDLNRLIVPLAMGENVVEIQVMLRESATARAAA